ncbi:MAG: hypothetical protein SFX73_05520, partial [Kofleriaceae bacterium]|nr:hypothetical protein [Kofleriaceae bacterium]
GLGLAAIGIVALLVVTLGGGSHEDVAEHEPIIMKGSQEKAPEPPVEKIVEPPSPGSAADGMSSAPATNATPPDTETPETTNPKTTNAETTPRKMTPPPDPTKPQPTAKPMRPPSPP